MAKLILEFEGETNPELTCTSFSHALLEGKLTCVRGKSCGAFWGAGSFQWTAAVRALGLLFVRTKRTAMLNLPGIIDGGRGSLAASLDYAIDKECLWLSDMFGVDSNGRLLAKRMLNRTNPSRKRSGPVSLSVNKAFLAASNISIIYNGKYSTSAAELVNLENYLLYAENCAIAA